MKYILLTLAIFTLAGCATDKDYSAYLAAQTAANTQAAHDQKPLVRIEAQEGQTITGLKSVEVYTPTATPVIQQAQPSQWAGVVNTGMGITGTVLGIRAAGTAAIGLADSVGRAGASGYQYIQAPGAVTTSTYGANSGANSGNSGNLAGTGSTVTAPIATATPTVVNQPAPVVVLAPNPVIVPTTPPVVVQPCVVAASGVGGCQ